jgi:phage terminase small subunit
MRLRPGAMTDRQAAFVHHMARTNDRAYAAHKAGYTDDNQGHVLMRDVKIREAILAEQIHILETKAIPLGVGRIVELLESDLTRDVVYLQAVKTARETYRDLNAIHREMTGGKSLHDMEPAALMQLASQLQAKADAIDAEPVPEGGVFD